MNGSRIFSQLEDLIGTAERSYEVAHNGTRFVPRPGREVNIQDGFSVPDDGTDASSALAEVIAAVPAEGATIVGFLPGKTYAAADLKPNARTHFQIPPGASLKKLGGSQTMALIEAGSGKDDVTISGGGTIDGNVANNEGADIGAIVQRGGNRLTVHGMSIVNASYGVRASRGDDLKVIAVRFSGTFAFGGVFAGDGPVGEHADDALVALCTFLGTYGGAPIKAHHNTPSLAPKRFKTISNHVEPDNEVICIEIKGGCLHSQTIGNSTFGGTIGVSLDDAPFAAVIGNPISGPSSVGIEAAKDCGGAVIGMNPIDCGGVAKGIGVVNTGNADVMVVANPIHNFADIGLHFLEGQDHTAALNRFVGGSGQAIYVQDSHGIYLPDNVGRGITGRSAFVTLDDSYDVSIPGARFDGDIFLYLYARGRAITDIEVSNASLRNVTQFIAEDVDGDGSIGSGIRSINATGQPDYLDYATRLLRMLGTGSPDAVVTAGKGSTYVRIDGNGEHYRKTTSMASAAGWVEL